MTSADLSLSLWVYFYLRALEHEMMYQWRTCSPALWIKMTVGFFSGSSPQVRRKKHSCWSVFFVHTEGRESLRQAYIRLFFLSLSFFLYLRRHHHWDKKLTSECGHFEEWVSNHPAGMFAVQQYRDGNTMTFFMFAVLQPTNHPMIKLKCVDFFCMSTLKVL